MHISRLQKNDHLPRPMGQRPGGITCSQCSWFSPQARPAEFMLPGIDWGGGLEVYLLRRLLITNKD